MSENGNSGYAVKLCRMIMESGTETKGNIADIDMIYEDSHVGMLSYREQPTRIS